MKIHIFEERYKELVNDCLSNKASFVIPFIDNNEPSEYGAEVKIKNVLKEFPDGKKDIMVECIAIVRILDSTEELTPKLYGAVTVEFESEPEPIKNINLQDAIIHYFSSVQNKLIDYETIKRLNVYNIAASLQLSPQEKLSLVTAKNKELVLLNQINFITHIINAEQQLNNRFIFN